MPDKLNFHFPLALLLEQGDKMATAAEANPDLNVRLPVGFVADTRDLIDTVTTGDATQKADIGDIGTLTLAQNAALATLQNLVGSAKDTAKRAFKGNDPKLHAEFQVGINKPTDLASLLERAHIVSASLNKAENLPALTAKGCEIMKLRTQELVNKTTDIRDLGTAALAKSPLRLARGEGQGEVSSWKLPDDSVTHLRTVRLAALTAAITGFTNVMSTPRGQIVNRSALLKEAETDVAAPAGKSQRHGRPRGAIRRQRRRASDSSKRGNAPASLWILAGEAEQRLAPDSARAASSVRIRKIMNAENIELNAIRAKKYPRQREKLRAWQSASQVERAAQREQQPPTPPTPPPA